MYRTQWRRNLNALLGLCVKHVPCPHACSRHVDSHGLPAGGQCVAGRCQCFKGWGTEDCSERTCPFNCAGHGQCKAGICECAANWFGAYCTRQMPMQCIKSCYFSCMKTAGPDAESGGQSAEKSACETDCVQRKCKVAGNERRTNWLAQNGGYDPTRHDINYQIAEHEQKPIHINSLACSGNQRTSQARANLLSHP